MTDELDRDLQAAARENLERMGVAHRPSKQQLIAVPVDPQPTYIESSGRWLWPLPERARFPGCCTEVVTASREWWEYAPSEAKPHPHAEAVRLRDDKWIWVWEALVETPLLDASLNRLAENDTAIAKLRGNNAYLIDVLKCIRANWLHTQHKVLLVDGVDVAHVIAECDDRRTAAPESRDG